MPLPLNPTLADIRGRPVIDGEGLIRGELLRPGRGPG